MTGHLLFSTVVLAVTMLAARFLPLTARTRYALILCGLLKFAIPTAIFDVIPNETIPQPVMRVFGATTAMPIAAAAPETNWLFLIWAAIATLLFARWLLLRARTIHAALRAPAAPSARELEALRRAKQQLGIRSAVDLIRSPICEAPAVLRVIRPAIVLPAHGCDDLTDDELESLLLHECAHIARRDNLATIAQSLATSLLWFHPLVWLASRQLSAAREEACDERVSEGMRGNAAYLDALMKICHQIAAPRTAGASCMASSHLEERIEHLMSYESIRNRAWSHRALVTAMVFLIALTTVAATAPRAGKSSRYGFTYDVQPQRGGEIAFNIQVKQNGNVLREVQLRASANERTTATFDLDNGADVLLAAQGDARQGELQFRVTGDGRVLHEEFLRYNNSHGEKDKIASDEFSGAPINIQLKDAKLTDVMNTFAELTGLDIEVRREAAGVLITTDIVNMPWDQALDKIARDHGLTITVNDKILTVSKSK